MLPVEEEVVRQAYGALADQYIELIGSTAQVHDDDLALITRYLSIRPGTVLDVGCGPGHLTAHLRSLGIDSMGLDLVPSFISHARSTDPGGRYGLASMAHLPVGDRSVAGVLAWYSLIHVPPDELDDVLRELRRAMVPAGVLVTGFFDGAAVEVFDHKVTTANRWPIDELSLRLRRAGFVEVERQQRPANVERGIRSHAALVATAS